MRKLFVFLAVVAAAMILLPSSVAAADTENFTITNFSTDYHVSKNSDGVGQASITETITAQFPDFNQNHGLRRAIPEVYKKNSLGLKINSVKNQEGQTLTYTTKSQNNNLVLFIGDPDSFVHGSQTYVIKYDVSNIITFYNDHDEWFWDINGNQWGQIVQNVFATVTFDNSIADNLLPAKKCFTGSNDSNQSSCYITEQANGSEAEVMAGSKRMLNPNETMTLVLGFKPGTFSKPPVNTLAAIGQILTLVVSVLLPIIVLIVVFNKWRQSGRDPKGKGIIVPQYKPQEGLNLLVSDVILNEQMRPLAISATILDLCIKGYLKVYEIKKKKLFKKSSEYELELTRLPTDLSAEEQKLVSILFTKLVVGSKINISEQENKLFTGVAVLQSLSEQAATKQGFYTKKPTEAKKQFIIIGIILLGFAFVLFMYFSKLPTVIIPLIVALGFCGVILFVFSRIMPARTVEGVQAKEYLLGLKDYMKLAEADRIKTLQSPQGAEKMPAINVNDKAQLIKLYEKLLPYAILFGIEKDWSKQIAPLYSQPPDWYSGSSTFNSAMFVGAVSNISTASASSFSAPSSSGLSGFAGGGAGGGGGGGGGGGW